MKRIVAWMDRQLYPEYESNWDDTLFRAEVLKVLKPEHVLLDVGAGAGIVSQMNFRGVAQRVTGIDLDPRVASNPYLDDSMIAGAESIPYPDNAFDVVIADNTLEHFENPKLAFEEIARVLKPGGFFLAKTPNKWHYMPIIARITPHWFHESVGRLRGRMETDTFPTLYRSNTLRTISRHARCAGLRTKGFKLIEARPEYLRFAFPAYFVGWVYERIVNSTPALQSFRILIIAILQKPVKASQ